jgi:hypothetical protein
MNIRMSDCYGAPFLHTVTFVRRRFSQPLRVVPKHTKSCGNTTGATVPLATRRRHRRHIYYLHTLTHKLLTRWIGIKGSGRRAAGLGVVGCDDGNGATKLRRAAGVKK